MYDNMLYNLYIYLKYLNIHIVICSTFFCYTVFLRFLLYECNAILYFIF